MNALKKAIIQSKKLLDSTTDVKALEKKFEEAEKLQMERKSNEIMNTSASDFGTELIPDKIQLDPLLDLVPTYSTLINLLPGSHWTNLGKSIDLPIIWESDMFSWNTEWSTGAPTPATPADEGPPTDEITITQGMFILKVAVSKRELNYAPMNLEAIIKNRINMSAARTIDAVFLNWDSAAANNVNYDGWTPATTLYYKQCDGWIRNTVLDDTNTNNVWTFSEADLIATLWKLANWYQADLSNLLWIMPANVYNKAMLFDSVLTMDKFWPNATISKWVLAKAFWIDVLVARDWPALAQATWLVSSTTWSNTVGSYGLIYKPSMQYGFGQALEIEPYKVPGRWIVLYATMEFGQWMAYDKAGLWNTAALWINVTVQTDNII